MCNNKVRDAAVVSVTGDIPVMSAMFPYHLLHPPADLEAADGQ
jgi:hypothetical protein